MSKKTIPGYIDENGIFMAAPRTAEVLPDISLDDIGKRLLIALDRASTNLLKAITAGDITRETIGSLKDCGTMLKELKKDEKDYLSSLSDDELLRLKNESVK